MLGVLKNWLERTPPLSTDRRSYLLGAATSNAVLKDRLTETVRLAQPSIFCDIGAHDGQAAIGIRAILPSAKIYAFEANPVVHQTFCRSPDLEGISYENVAISDREGVATIFAPRTLTKMYSSKGIEAGTRISEPLLTRKGSLLFRNGETTYTEYQVPARTLDGFFASQFDHHTFALWIDVEGAADKVLRGGLKTLERTLIVFVEVENYEFWRRQKKSAHVAGMLERLGFVAAARDNEFGEYQYNVLFVRRSLVPIIAALQENRREPG